MGSILFQTLREVKTITDVLGPADLRITDKGYFGAGIYSTLQAGYAIGYANGSLSGIDLYVVFFLIRSKELPSMHQMENTL